jgi:FAD/FMN-containing dehydrogenase/Fe-S oxidoreductase
MDDILEINPDDKTVRVQPGVELAELNRKLAEYDLMFGPDTSTDEQCTIGGMIGNNSCGSHSIFYGTTRQNLQRLGLVFSDGEYCNIGRWDTEKLKQLIQTKDGALGDGLSALCEGISEHEELIAERYPAEDVLRRNTGYPLDEIARQKPFANEGESFFLPAFLTGTEGTLAMTAEATLQLVDRPKAKRLLCAHFETLEAAMEATTIAVEAEPAAVELMDRRIMEQTRNHPKHKKNRFFVNGDPAAILFIEFYGDDGDKLEDRMSELVKDFRAQRLGYSYPRVGPPRDSRVWKLRKAGLGLLMGMLGDTKPVTVVEDTAVSVRVLPEYVDEFSKIMERHGTQCVYYGHASVGELHLRPELNLKKPQDLATFRSIAKDVAELVREYDGAMSGEHGDGRLRGPLLEDYFGPELMELHREVKEAFDPRGIFNPGKIIDSPDMGSDLRVNPGEPEPDYETSFDWSDDGGFIQAIEKCNGAGVCRQRADAGGTMCPSYHATADEKDTTRGRANVFRQVFVGEKNPTAFEDEDLKEALDLCLSCKACKSECPANVDMAKLKAEFLQHYHEEKGDSISSRIFAEFPRISRFASLLPGLVNFLMSLSLVKWLMEVFGGIARERQLPMYASETFDSWFESRESGLSHGKIVWLYVDPFTQYVEPEIGKAAVRVLEAVGYRVETCPIEDDGRTLLSKGYVERAKQLWHQQLNEAGRELEAYSSRPIIGLEPSAILTFVDEVPDLIDDKFAELAENLGDRAYLFEEFIERQLSQDSAIIDWGEPKQRRVLLHRHCHEKALRDTDAVENVLERGGYDVHELNTGCCGMAGSFGYEKEHHKVSLEIGEQTLFPPLREAGEDMLIAAPGTSCRHQIKDGVERTAHHPAVLLERVLNS